MKILKKPPEFKPFTCSCANCGASLEVDCLEDLDRVKGSDFRESWDYLKIECPCCEGTTKFETTVVPKHLLEKISVTSSF